MRKESSIYDVSGKPASAIKVFSLSIKYLKDHCLKVIKERGVLNNPKDVKFVLTVPAIWTDRSKQFMRVAANQVKKKLLISIGFGTFVNGAII